MTEREIAVLLRFIRTGNTNTPLTRCGARLRAAKSAGLLATTYRLDGEPRAVPEITADGYAFLERTKGLR